MAGHKLCTESAEQQGCGLSALLCKSFSWCASSFVLLGLAATAISLIDQVSVGHLFCFCLSLHGTTIVLDNNKRQLFYKQIEIFMALT